MTDFIDLNDGEPCAGGRKDRHPLLIERELLERKYLTDPAATEADRAAYLAKDRECREAGLLPKTK